MPTNTYTPLATVTLTSTDSEIIFGSIPNTYRDLILVYNGQTTSSGNFDLQLKLNGATTNTSAIILYGAGNGGYGTFTQSNNNLLNIGSDVRSAVVIQVLDYSDSNKQKVSFIRANGPTTTALCTQRWASTTPVSSLNFAIGSGAFAIGSTFSLFGVIG